jgi:hypothetical protein
MSINFDQLISHALNFKVDRSYWLIRTMDGDYYDEYVSKGFVAIGYDDVSLREVKLAASKGEAAHRELTAIIESKDSKQAKDKQRNAGYASSQLLTFCTKVEVDDIIVIPSRSSGRICIGTASSKMFEIDSAPKGENSCPFKKRVEVKWGDKEYFRHGLNPKMQLMFSSRHIISKVNAYSELIDSSVHNFYQKGDRCYLVLRVNAQGNVSASDMSAVFELLALLEEFAQEQNLPYRADDIQIKVCVQSPGDIVMSASPAIILALGAIVVLIFGGAYKRNGEDIEISTPGILEGISNFLDRRQDRIKSRNLTEKLKNMQIEDPSDLIELLKDDKKPRKEY